ncbi:LIM and cysteine-rich domains protein 1 isoform X1 [Larimichthys crocea]|uniref:LIM and cysteine-rich domains protein 1 isoform X1 n=1 Tax=Larimichthys crocea TaxID=215358 RepID=UPI000F5E0818|nr:LIM and cysteine-rich domains protein 1 isoform X1 [Larimichthys crocea]XP_027135033.1 LIM and cysteine-rich domains protein 1 isoform X1 [Larimichthys crocea]
MDVSSAMEKMSIKQSAGGAAVCLVCDGSCSGFQPHSWRKACIACGCSTIDHAPGSDVEDDQRMGRLLTDSPCAHLTTKIKGGGGLRLYKRNRMIVTNPVVSRKDPTFNTTTYDWAPAGLNQTLAMQYMELIPESQRPVSGTEGASERRRQLFSQLPVYDQDPMKCQSLTSEEEITSMLLFVKQYKQEVLGVGEVALPGEGRGLREAAIQRTAKEAKDRSNSNSNKKDAVEHQGHGSTNSSSATGSTNGTDETTKIEYRCAGCQGEVAKETPAVYAERAGYHSALWHPTCFVCSECGHGLADLVYFWSNQKLFCGRHYCQMVWPRCSGCDELIFCQSFYTAEDGRTWHQNHYCCWKCGQNLDTPCQH